MNNVILNLIDLTPSRRRRDRNGYLHVESCHLTKEQVAPYLGREISNHAELGLRPDKIYRLLRPREELAKAAASSNGLTILLRHEHDNAWNPQKALRIGALGTRAHTVEEGGEFYLDNDLSFHDATAVELVESGECTQLSASYFIRAEMTPGIWRGQAYDGVMRDPEFNHVALVKKGRAGPDCAVADSAQEISPILPTGASAPNSNPSEEPMKKTLKERLLAKFKQDKPRLLVMDEDPAQAEALVQELIAEVQSEAPAKVQDSAPPGEPPAADPLKDASPAEKLKSLLAPLLNGLTEVNGKSVDEFLAELAAALGLAEAAAQAGQVPAALMDGLPLWLHQLGKQHRPGHSGPWPPSGHAPARPVMDEAAIEARLESKIAKKLQEEQAAKEAAVQAVQPLVGQVSMLAFDSAEAVYAYAAEKRGFNPKDYPAAALPGLVKALADVQAAMPAFPIMDGAGGTGGPNGKDPLKDLGIDVSRYNLS